MVITVTTGWWITCVQSCSVELQLTFCFPNRNLLLFTAIKPCAVASQNSNWSYSRVGILLSIPYCQRIPMTETLVIIHSSNHSDAWSLYLVREVVSAVEHALPYFLCSLVFQMVEINCMACWCAPEMAFLFSFKANCQLSDYRDLTAPYHRRLYHTHPHRPPQTYRVLSSSFKELFFPLLSITATHSQWKRKKVSCFLCRKLFKA